MMTADRRGIVAVALAVLLLALGVCAAMLVTDAIDVRTELAPVAPAWTRTDLTMAWLARGLLVLALAWILIGIMAARTSLVARPGAAAARASWLAATRPWRARESTLGMLSLDRWLVFLVPVALLVATRAVQTSLLGWVRLVVVLGAWAVFALVLRLVVRKRSPWAVIAAVGGMVMLRCILTLIALSIAGPGGYWYAFWELPAVRGAYITVASAAFLWAFIAASWSLFAQIGPRRAVGAMLCACGAGIAVPAAVVGVIGLERALTVWDDRTGLLPWGLTRMLGLTLRVDIPDGAVWWAVIAGAVACAIGGALAVHWEALGASRTATVR